MAKPPGMTPARRALLLAALAEGNTLLRLARSGGFRAGAAVLAERHAALLLIKGWIAPEQDSNGAIVTATGPDGQPLGWRYRVTPAGERAAGLAE